MHFKYQLIFLGDITNSAYGAIKDAFFAKIRDLGITNAAFDVICADDFIHKYTSKQPTFVYYLGCRNNPGTDSDILAQLFGNGDAIYPLYFNQQCFENEIPEVIRDMNGSLYVPNEVEAIVNCALEYFRLLRKSRRVFISYKRSEATHVAQQLFDLLIQNGFDPFLDAYSIRPADNFQEELFHRMTDCDVLIQLHTPEFFNSTWCQQEIKEANLKQIGVVVVLWPQVELKSFSHLCTPISLKKESFLQNDILNKDTANTIINTIESVRARNLAARQDSICGEFVAEASKYGKRIIQEYRYLLEKDNEGNDIRLFIPAVGIPQSYDCFESRNFRELLKKEELEIYLLYDSLRIRKKWIEHLDWLNEVLDVKTIKRKEFESWVRKH